MKLILKNFFLETFKGHVSFDRISQFLTYLLVQCCMDTGQDNENRIMPVVKIILFEAAFK